HETEGAGSDRMGVDGAVFDDLAGDDRHALESADVHQEVRGRAGQADLDGPLVDRVDRFDRLEPVGVGRPRFGIHDPLEGVDDVVGGQVPAVVELHSFAQVEGPGELIVGDVPALGEGRVHRQVVAGLDASVGDVR